jgi:small subunit ribosomal protein S20
MAEDQKKKAKVKLPTAQKRQKQSEKRQLANRSRKSQIHTAKLSFDSLIKSKDLTAKEKLDQIFSLVDKAAKKGVITSNKAARTKSRLSSKFNHISKSA